MELLSERHYILYSKYHYKRNNIIDDLKKIQSNYTGVPSEYITTKDILIILNRLVMKMYVFESGEFSEYRYNDVFFEIIGKSIEEVIEKLLSLLSTIIVNDYNKETKESTPIINLGYPDSNILELNIQN